MENDSSRDCDGGIQRNCGRFTGIAYKVFSSFKYSTFPLKSFDKWPITSQEITAKAQSVAENEGIQPAGR